ncbi:MAG: signal peptidase II [Egibacteraceae bacterium]
MIDEEQQQVTRPPRARLSYALWGAVAAGWLVLDQVSKALAVSRLERQGAVDLGVVALRVIRNPGGAFGIPGVFPGLFVIVTVIVVAVVARALPRTDSRALVFAYGLVTGGALGNVVDRIVRAPGFPSGHVVDFIDLGWWPVFNLADVGICVGAGLIALLAARVERDERAGAPTPAAHR